MPASRNFRRFELRFNRSDQPDNMPMKLSVRVVTSRSLSSTLTDELKDPMPSATIKLFLVCALGGLGGSRRLLKTGC